MGIVKLEPRKRLLRTFSELKIGTPFVPYGEPERLYLKVSYGKCYNLADKTMGTCPHSTLLECDATLKWDII